MMDNSSATHGENMEIDDYDDYDAMNDQYAIDNYSIIGNNISKLKRFLSWFGFSSNDVYEIGDWSMNDNVELYNLDGSGTVEGEDVVKMMQRERGKKIRKTLMKVLGLIVVCGLFVYIVANLVIVNKEYVEIKEAHKSMTSSVLMSSSTSVGDNIFKKPTTTSLYEVDETSSTSSKTTSSSQKIEKTSSSSSKTKTTTTTKTKTTSSSTSKTKTKTKSSSKSTHTTATKGSGLGSLFEDLWEDAKEIGDEIVDEIYDIVDDLNHKIQDH